MGRNSVQSHPARSFVQWVDRRLQETYGDPMPSRQRPDPLAELIRTILSQNTTDRNRDRAYAALRKRWPTWEALLTAPVAEIEAAIRSGGLARQKSLRLKALLEEIKRREGKLDLSRLCTLPLAEAKEYLASFKGVGEKTTAVVLLFACDRPVFPVDTHILRLSRRLGLIPEKASPKTAHEIWARLAPAHAVYRLHLNLITHGRSVCRPRKPACASCCLMLKCPSAEGWTHAA